MKQIVDYVWIDGGMGLRSKTRVLLSGHVDTLDIPHWNYDGSSTNQASGDSSEIVIRPKKLIQCPFRENGYIVLCDTYHPDGTSTTTNHRVNAEEIFEKYADERPWYGMEQEYFIYDCRTNQPLGFPPEGGRQGQYYCSVGGRNAFGREISDLHLRYCLAAGFDISGTNAEVAPGQWEYQIGPAEGIDACDQLWLSRYILEKITERYNCYINWHPKPLTGHWNGSGCHVNFSTQKMRGAGGMEHILKAMRNLADHHADHMKIYGAYNQARMTGLCETANYDKFSWGVGDRGASVRIGNDVQRDGRGYFEDRRPASNMDPYQVCSKILETSVLD